MSLFTDKYKKLKQKDEEMRSMEDIDENSMDPDELKMHHEKMDYLFTTNIAKKIFDYDARQELIADFQNQTLAEKKAFLIKEFDINPDEEMLNLKPAELKYQQYNEAKRDLKVPVCRKCGKCHNPFEACFG
ncbi:MAG TPA: hypothetical protein VKM55_09550 [Candidatus Lokiarchaeia archaeon]|nr:hypothetical protein [Candidatus Lokiarchaeia archaeon]